MSMRQFIFQPAIVAYKWIKNLIVHGIIVGVLKKINEADIFLTFGSLHIIANNDIVQDI